MATRQKKISSKGGAGSIASVFKMAKDNDAKIVDYRFVDMPGMWQHFSSPIGTLEADTFEEGVGFDGSSIRGFQTINESDMLLMPDPTTVFMDPFLEIPTLVLICDIKDPITLQLYAIELETDLGRHDAALARLERIAAGANRHSATRIQ